MKKLFLITLGFSILSHPAFADDADKVGTLRDNLASKIKNIDAKIESDTQEMNEVDFAGNTDIKEFIRQMHPRNNEEIADVLKKHEILKKFKDSPKGELLKRAETLRNEITELKKARIDLDNDRCLISGGPDDIVDSYYRSYRYREDNNNCQKNRLGEIARAEGVRFSGPKIEENQILAYTAEEDKKAAENDENPKSLAFDRADAFCKSKGYDYSDPSLMAIKIVEDDASEGIELQLDEQKKPKMTKVSLKPIRWTEKQEVATLYKAKGRNVIRAVDHVYETVQNERSAAIFTQIVCRDNKAKIAALAGEISSEVLQRYATMMPAAEPPKAELQPNAGSGK